jgi:tetratricopeptide (TPR) repeat protein
MGAQVQALTTIEQDLDNIRPAWRRLAAMQAASGISKMVVGLWLIHESRGWYQSALALFADALDAMGEDKSPAPNPSRSFVVSMHGTFASMLGQVESGGEEVRTAFEELKVADDPVALFFTGMLKAQTHLYLGGFAEVVDVLDETIAQGESLGPDWAEGHFWVAAIKNFRAFVALRMQDTELAMRLLDESRAVLEPLDELYFMTWNLGHRARMAQGSGRLQDAIDLFRQSADRARRIGFPRAMQVSLTGLGEANLATGDLAAAEKAFVESLSVAERTGMVLEMLTSLLKIAQVFAADERQRTAVEILSTVIAEPASDHQMFANTTSTRSAGSEELESLRGSMDPEEYERALADGSSMTFRAVAKGLIDTISKDAY